MRATIRHATGVIAALGLAAGVIVATAGAGLTHSAIPHTSSVCNNDGTWSARFSATNDYGLTSAMSGTSTGLDGAYAKSGQSGDSRTITVTKPVATTSIAFPGSSGTMVWSDGFTQRGIAWSTATLPSGCKAPDVKDAAATVAATPGTCTAVGSASYTVSHAHLVGSFSTTVGTHSASFGSDTGHLFADGSTSKSIGYTVEGRNHALCGSVAPVGPTVTESVCQARYGGPTAPTLVLPTSGDFTYTVDQGGPYVGGQTVTVTATLSNPDTTNLSVPAGWVWTSDTTATLTVTFATVHCAPPPSCTACHLPRQSTDAPRVTECRGILVGGVYNTVEVRPGRDCTIVGGYVNGSINADGAHNVTLGDTTVRGSVYADRVSGTLTIGAVGSTCAADPMVGGSIYARYSHNVVLCNVQVCHGVFVQHSTGRIMVRESRMRRLVVTRNDTFVDDGSHHHAPGLIRLHHDRAFRFLIGHNARPVDRRDLRHAGRITGGRVCTV